MRLPEDILQVVNVLSYPKTRNILEISKIPVTG